MSHDPDLVLLIARVCLAAVFLYSGVTKAIDWPGTVAEMKFFNLPVPPLTAAVTVIWQLGGGLSVLSGVWAQTGAVALGVFTVIATMMGHGFWRHEGAEFKQHLNISLEHLAIVGGFVALALTGPGAYALGT